MEAGCLRRAHCEKHQSGPSAANSSLRDPARHGGGLPSSSGEKLMATPVLQPSGVPPEVFAIAGRGWPVFPCHSAYGGRCSCGDPNCGKHAGKHPRTPHGHRDATKDERQSSSWAPKWPSFTSRRLISTPESISRVHSGAE